MTDKTCNVLLLRTGNNAHAILGEARLLAMRFALGGV